MSRVLTTTERTALARLADRLDLPLVRVGHTFYRNRRRGRVDLAVDELDAMLTLVNAAPHWLETREGKP